MKHLPFLSSICLLLTQPHITARVDEGALSGSLNFYVFAGTGDASAEYSFEELDVEGENFVQQTIPLVDESDRGEVDAEAVVDISYSGQFIRQTSELTDLDFVTLTGNIYSNIEFSGSGFFLDTPGISAIFNSITPGNELSQEFTITEDGPELASITVTFNSRSESGSLASLRIQKFDNGNWTSVAVYTSTGYYTYHNENRSLEPGLYRIYGHNPTSEALGAEESSFSIEEGIFYEITFGSPPLELPFPEEGDFFYDGIGTKFTNPSNLQILNPTIVSEVALENDMTELTFAANLLNTSACPWQQVTISLTKADDATSGITATNDGVSLLNLDPFSTTPSNQNGVVQVPNDTLDTVKASILDASGLTVEGRELIVFRYPITFAWEELTDYQTDGNTRLEFYLASQGQPGFTESDPPLERGEILVEWEALYSVPMRFASDGEGGEDWVQNYDKELPILVTSVVLEPGVIQDPRPYYIVSGEKMSLLDIVKHGTIRHPVKNPLPGYTKNATEENQIEEQDNFPIPLLLTLNRFDLDDLIKVSGDFNFIPGEFEVEYSLSDSAVVDFLVRKSYTAEVNLLVETVNHEEVGGEPVVDVSKNLLTTPLFTTALPGGITFTTALDIDIGATANITRSLAIPFTSRYTYEVAAGVKDGAPHYEDNTDFHPLKVSDPQVFEEIGAELELWADADLLSGLILPDGSSSFVTGGARFDGSFGIHPLADPWWDLSADLNLTSGFELNLGVLFKLADEEVDLANYTLFEKQSEGPLLPGPIPSSLSLPPEGINPGLRPISDPNARWSRAIQMDTQTTETRDTFLIPLQGSTDFLTGQSNLTSNGIHRIASDGRILKTLSTPQNLFKAIDAAPLPDGGAIILNGSTTRLDLLRLDSTLQTTAHHRYNFGSLTYESLRIVASDTHAYVLGGDFFDGKYQAVISCLDFEGNLVWSRSFILDPTQALNPADIILCADGDLAFCSVTSADFTEEDGISDNLLLNISNNGLLAKVDSTTGDVLWASMIPHVTSSPNYYALAESPGREFTIGGYQSSWPGSEPTMMLLQLSDTGELLENLLIGYSGSAKAADNPAVSHLFSGLPHGGETYFDQIRDLVWTEEGLWACGEMGIYNPSSILSTGSSGFTIFFDPELNPSRFAMHGGRSQDSLDRIIITDTGPLVAGGSNSFLPWPIGASDEADNTPWAQWLLKLPWEGRIDFHDMSNAAQPDLDDPAPLAGSHSIYPRVVSDLLSNFADISQLANGQPDELNTHAHRSLTATDLTTTPEPLEVTLSGSDLLDYKALEYTPPSLVTNEASYLSWSQQNPDTDADGDGLDAAAEFYFDLDALSPDANDLKFIAIEPLTLEVSRNALADGLPRIWESANLIDWTEITPSKVDISESEDQDLIQIELPSEAGSSPLFWEATAP